MICCVFVSEPIIPARGAPNVPSVPPIADMMVLAYQGGSEPVSLLSLSVASPPPLTPISSLSVLVNEIISLTAPSELTRESDSLFFLPTLSLTASICCLMASSCISAILRSCSICCLNWSICNSIRCSAILVADSSCVVRAFVCIAMVSDNSLMPSFFGASKAANLISLSLSSSSALSTSFSRRGSDCCFEKAVRSRYVLFSV